MFENVRVEQTSTVRQSIIHPGVRIGENCRLNRVIIMENTVIPAGTTIEIDEFQEPFVINQETLGGMLTPAGGESK